MSEDKNLELKIMCHIYIPIGNESQAKEKLDWFEDLSREQGFEYQIYKEEIQDIG